MESILAQNYQNFEIILVNDGSTDQSGNLCDQYASEYSNIYVIHSENEGPGPSRNKGLKRSRGQYIYFVDSDDRIRINTLSNISAVIELDRPDVVIFGYTKREKKGKKCIITESSLPELKLNSRKIIKQELCNLLHQGIRFSLWNKVFKKSVIDKYNIHFPAFKRSQDMAFTLDFLSHTTSLYVLDKSYYVHENKFVSEKYDDSLIDVHITLFTKLYHLFPEWHKVEHNAAYLGKLFAFWFFLKIPKILLSNHDSTVSKQKLREMASLERVQKFSDAFYKNDALAYYYRIPNFMLNKQLIRFIYYINYILKPIEHKVKKTLT